MFNALVLWLHIFAATVWVGPQVFLVAAAVPAMRTIEDVAQRARATRIVTSRFGWLGGGALAVLVATGLINWAHASDTGLSGLDRYFFVLQVKLTLVATVIALTVLHGGVVGRRLLRLQEAGAPPAEVDAVRRWSVVFSAATLAVSIAILLCSALLASDWSKR